MNRHRIQQLIDWLAAPISNEEPSFDMGDWARTDYDDDDDDAWCGTACCLAGKAVVDMLVEDCAMPIDDAVSNVEHGFHPVKNVSEMAAEWLDLPLDSDRRYVAVQVPLFHVGAWPGIYRHQYYAGDARTAAASLLRDMLAGTVDTRNIKAGPSIADWWAQYGVTP